MTLLTFEHPGVKAPGTAKMINFFPAEIWAKLTLFVGLFSNKSTEGSLSPTY